MSMLIMHDFSVNWMRLNILHKLLLLAHSSRNKHDKILTMEMIFVDGKCLIANIRGFLNAFAKGLAKLLPKTLCDGIMNKDINKWIQ